MSELEAMGAAAINLGWLGWSAAAEPVWLPSWMLLSTLQVTQASLTTKQPASAEKLAFVENRKIEVKCWHFTKIKLCYDLYVWCDIKSI